jgi:hypothetical protein
MHFQANRVFKGMLRPGQDQSRTHGLGPTGIIDQYFSGFDSPLPEQSRDLGPQRAVAGTKFFKARHLDEVVSGVPIQLFLYDIRLPTARTLAVRRRETGKNRGVDPAKGYHSGAHAVVLVSRGGEDAQGEGDIALAFFGPLKQFVEINSNVGKMLRGDFTVPLGGYLITALF